MENVFNLLAPENKKVVNHIDGNNTDIVQTLLAAVPKAIQQGTSIYKPFLENDIVKTCAKVWHFVKYKIAYETDIPGTQNIQLPSALLASKRGDCKSKTLLCVAILSNALPGCKIFIRFVSYDKNDPTPTHVYCFVITPGGKKILVDSVYFAFDKEKRYFYKKDFQIMEISTISGFETANYSDIGRTKSERKARRKARREGRKEKRKGRKEKRSGAVKKVALAPARNAFLILTAINARGLANNLFDSDQDKVKKIWNAVGGNYDKLYKSVKVGNNKKPFLGNSTKEVEGLENYSIGATDGGSEGGSDKVEGVSDILSIAGPIIAIFTKLFQSIRDNRKRKEADKLKAEAEEAGGDTNIPNGEVGDPEPGSGKKPSGGGSDGGIMDTVKDNLPLIAAAGIGLYFLTKKK